MTRISTTTACRLAVGIFMGLATMAQARAEDFGVARVTDRPRPVVRAQSPALSPAPAQTLQPISAMELAACEEPDDDDLDDLDDLDDDDDQIINRFGAYSPAGASGGYVTSSYVTSEGVTPGLHYSVSCPEHGGVYDDGCPKCRYFAGFGQGDWVLDPHGHPIWNGPAPHGNIFDKMFTGVHNMGEKFCSGLKKFDKCLAKHGNGDGQPLFGHYRIVYPVNPWYFDGRDGQVYAAEGYGGPVSVPLAPIVRQQYNYGWGVPSSRITPISRPLPLGGQPGTP